MKHGFAGAAAVVLAGSLVAAQQPTFRVQIDAIELDAFVTDAQGNPVRGLTVDDFELFEDGKPQVITSFSQVDIPFEARVEPIDAKGAVDPDVVSNDRSEGRVYLFILDEVAPVDALRSRVFLRRFLQQHFAANDRAAVVFLGHQDSGAAQPFTNNPRQLLAAFDRFTGGFPTEDVSKQATFGDDNALSAAVAAAAATRRVENFRAAQNAQAQIAGLDTMVGLESAVKMMAGLHGRRKAVLLFSSGLPEAIFRALSYEGGAMNRAEAAAHAAVTAATRGNVTIYPIDPAGLVTGMLDGRDPDAPDQTTIDNGPSDRRMSLSMLADATGGFSLVNSNNFKTAFDRIVRENSTYYVLGFTSTNEKRDGLHRSLRVRVTRPGLQVRAREGYVAPLKNERLPEPSRIDALSTPVSNALTNPLSEGTVPIRLFAASFRAEDKNALVALSAEIDPSGLGLLERGGTFNGQLEVGFLATDVRGKVYRGQHYTADVNLKPATYALARDQGIRVLSQMRLPPGRYQLRFAAGNPSGHAGSVVYDLTVPDFRKSGLMLSGLALTSTSTLAAATVAPGDPLAHWLPRPATARRTFAARETIGVFGEVYDNATGSTDAAIDIGVELVGRDGYAVRTTTAHGSRFMVTLPLDELDPGPYVVHVEAQVSKGKPRNATRDIPIQINAR
jgi:VWFA-related protein